MAARTMPPRSFSSRLSVAFGAAPTSDGGAPSAEDPGAGGGVRRASFWQGQGGATPKGSPSEVELGSTPTPTAARPGGRPGMPMRQQKRDSQSEKRSRFHFPHFSRTAAASRPRGSSLEEEDVFHEVKGEDEEGA